MSRSREKESSPGNEQKEGIGQSVFEVRFGFGAHNTRSSDWHLQMGRDMATFFSSSLPSNRNVFFLEDALGTQTFEDKIKRAYRAYSNYNTAYAYANAWFDPSNFPSSSRAEEVFETQLAKQSPFTQGGLLFTRHVLGILDQIIDQNGIPIDIVIEKRKDKEERDKITKIVKYQTSHMPPRFVGEFQEWVVSDWTQKKVRDKKIVDDFMGMHRSASKNNTPTRVYVSLGSDHTKVADLLITRLGSYQGVNISSVKGHNPAENHPVRVAVFTAEAHLDSGNTISGEMWKQLYEIATKR